MPDFFKKYKEKQLKKILESHKDSINDISDLVGDQKPSLLFYFLADKIGYVLDNDPKKCFSKEGVEKRAKINKVLKIVARLSMKNPHVIVDRNTLIESDEKLPLIPELPDRPVIFSCNHYFKDDVSSTIISSPRNGYILFGSIPMLFGTIDGFFAWMNGIVAVNRKSKNSKSSVLSKAGYLLDLGGNMFYYAEGVHNKSMEKLSLDLFPGMYRLAKEKGALIVPMHHYIKDPLKSSLFKNKIYTVIDDPIDVSNMSEKEACEYIRDVHATWHYLLMEKYGKSTREESLNGFETANEAWDDFGKKYLKGIARYDAEIETSADYRPKTMVSYLSPNAKSVSESEIEIPHNCIIKAPKLDDEARKKVMDYLQLDEGNMEYLSDRDLESYYRVISWEEKIKNSDENRQWTGIEKPVARPEDVFAPIAELELDEGKDNLSDVVYARKLVKREKERDFQRRF